MLAWIDLETTGLDPAVDVILEIAVIVTDDDLNIVAEGPVLIVHHDDETLARMDDFAAAMHTRSGLIADVKASDLSLAAAGEAVAAFLRTHLPHPAETPLCGSTISFDRGFLARWLPDIDTMLHYRSIDVSTVKELARRWAPAVKDSAPAKRKAHRALDDITESIDELRHYRNSGFISRQ